MPPLSDAMVAKAITALNRRHGRWKGIEAVTDSAMVLYMRTIGRASCGIGGEPEPYVCGCRMSAGAVCLRVPYVCGCRMSACESYTSGGVWRWPRAADPAPTERPLPHSPLSGRVSRVPGVGGDVR